MMNLERNRLAGPGFAAATVAMLSSAVLFTGCAEEPPPPPPVVQQRPVDPGPPPPPPVVSVRDLIQQRGLSDLLYMEEEQAPGTTEERILVLEFFDAFARGDARSLGAMMTMLDAAELDMLEKEGVWEEMTRDIAEIKIRTGTGPDGQRCALALFVVNGRDEAQLWYYMPEPTDPQFESAPCPPGMVNRLHGDDQIALWHEIIADEAMLAMRPDEDVSISSVNIDTATSDGSVPFAPPGGGAPGVAPTFDPGGGGGRRPSPPPRRPPGS
jgi:hypothetical protein